MNFIKLDELYKLDEPAYPAVLRGRLYKLDELDELYKLK